MTAPSGALVAAALGGVNAEAANIVIAVLMVVAVIGSFATAILVGMLADANRAANMWHRRALSLEEENDDLRHRLADLTGAAAYSCGRCGARFGIAGPHTESAQDTETRRAYLADVQYHESGLCQVEPPLAHEVTAPVWPVRLCEPRTNPQSWRADS